MAQQHCILPWQKGISETLSTLTQHLQGTLIHGRSMTIYRTFHNVRLNANQQCHALLLQLEEVCKLNRGLPETLYIQVDGGAENANSLLLKVISLLVARRVGGIQKIVVTRLPVGHTHEVRFF